MDAEKLADFITSLIFAEREMVLAALETDDEEMLENEVYEYITNH